MKQKCFFIFIIAILALVMSSCCENGPFTLMYQGTVEKIYKEVGNDVILLGIKAKDGEKISNIPISSAQDISTIYKIEEGTYVYIYKVSEGKKYFLSSIEMTPKKIETYWENRNCDNNRSIGIIIFGAILVGLGLYFADRLQEAKGEVYELTRELETLMPDKDDDD